MAQLQVKPELISKFEEISGIKLSDIVKAQSKIQIASFNKFSLTDEINLKLLTVQGIKSEVITLDSKRNAEKHDSKNLKEVYLFMVKNNKIVKFYSAYVVNEKSKVSKIKTETVSVTPLNAQNNRQKKQSEFLTIDSAEIKSHAVIEKQSEPSEIDNLKAQISELRSMLDLALSGTAEKKTGFLSKLKK